MKYTSINSVLYNLSLSVDESQFDETRFREFALQGYRKMESYHKYTTTLCLVPIVDHKGTIPGDAVHIIQIAYKNSFTAQDITLIKQMLGIDQDPTVADPDAIAMDVFTATFGGITGWHPMRPSSNSFLGTITADETVFPNINLFGRNIDHCTDCTHEYSVDHTYCMTTTLNDGLVYVAYLGYAKDADGNYLIPDEENLKESLYHYCMYRYHLSKPADKANETRLGFHLKQYEVLKAKAQANLNQPTVDEMENIKNMTTRLVPRAYQFESLFSKLTNKESGRIL